MTEWMNERNIDKKRLRLQRDFYGSFEFQLFYLESSSHERKKWSAEPLTFVEHKKSLIAQPLLTVDETVTSVIPDISCLIFMWTLWTPYRN